jgi:hypothetical protein
MAAFEKWAYEYSPRFFFAGGDLNLFSPIITEKIVVVVYTPSRSIDPGSKSHLITFPCSERTAASTRSFI